MSFLHSPSALFPGPLPGLGGGGWRGKFFWQTAPLLPGPVVFMNIPLTSPFLAEFTFSLKIVFSFSLVSWFPFQIFSRRVWHLPMAVCFPLDLSHLATYFGLYLLPGCSDPRSKDRLVNVVYLLSTKPLTIATPICLLALFDVVVPSVFFFHYD